MNHSELEKVSKALGDKTRLEIFEAISCRDSMHCGDIVAMQGVTPATVSHHLKVLEEAGLIESHREGQFIFRCALPQRLKEYTAALAKIGSGRKRSRKH